MSDSNAADLNHNFVAGICRSCGCSVGAVAQFGWSCNKQRRSSSAIGRGGAKGDQRSFRSSSWGDTQLQVLSNERAQLINKSDDALLYMGELNDSACIISFAFERGRLVQGAYMLDSADHIDVLDFFQLKDMLDEKYSPVELIPEWRGGELDFDLHDHRALGHAVALGRLSLMAFYTTTDSSITLSLQDESNEYNAHVVLLYTELAHQDVDEQRRRIETKSML